MENSSYYVYWRWKYISRWIRAFMAHKVKNRHKHVSPLNPMFFTLNLKYDFRKASRRSPRGLSMDRFKSMRTGQDTAAKSQFVVTVRSSKNGSHPIAAVLINVLHSQMCRESNCRSASPRWEVSQGVPVARVRNQFVAGAARWTSICWDETSLEIG